MTTPRRDNGDTAFSAWIRSQPSLDSGKGFDLEDCDRSHHQYFWNQYLRANIMFLEEKQYMRRPSPAQQDTLGIVNQALKHSFGDPGFKVKRKFPGRPTEYTYFGYRLIQFEKTSPKDGRIFIDYVQVTEQELLRFLQFDKSFFEEKLRFNALTIPIGEHSEQYLLPKPKRGLRKGNRPIVPNLFNLTPVQQQVFPELEVVR